MPRNGSGTYTLPAGNPVVTGTTISSTWANTTLSDIGTGLTNSIAKDGQTTPTANLPMGGFRHTGVGNAVARSDYASAGQVQDGSITYLTSVAGTNTITATALLSMTGYVAGQNFRFISAGANTGAVTLNINGIGAVNVTKKGATALASGDIPAANLIVNVTYDGTRFQLTSVYGTAAYLDVGTSANNVVQLTAAAKYPAVDGSLITNIVVPDASITAAKLSGAQSGSAPIFGARAWVNFDASTGTPTIKGSGNVSTISDNGIGYFSVNFTTNMQDANYCVNVSISGAGGSSYYSSDFSLASNTFTFKTRDAGATQTDLAFNMVTIYR